MARPLVFDDFVGGACLGTQKQRLLAKLQQEHMTVSEWIRQQIDAETRRELPRREGGHHGFDPAA